MLILILSISNWPIVIIQLNGLGVIELFALIIFPRADIILRVQNTRVKKLPGKNSGEILADFHIPAFQEVHLVKILNQSVDSVKAILWLWCLLAADVAHFIFIIGETWRKGCLIATRRNQMNILVSLFTFEDRLIKLPLFNCNIIFLLHVFNKSYILFSCNICERIFFFPFEYNCLWILIPEYTVDLINRSIVRGHYN